MDGIQIALLIAGGLIFAISFFLPGRKEKRTVSEDAGRMTEDQIKFMVEKEIDDAKQHINEVVDETISYAMEKTERSMERVSNEKILAINEYSDTVLEEINKNQQEVVFLYDMLNDKHENLKKTVSQAAITASEVQQTVRDAEVTAREAGEAAKASRKKVTQEEKTVQEEAASFQPAWAEKLEQVPADASIESPPIQGTGIQRLSSVAEAEEVSNEGNPKDMDIHFKGGGTGGRNNNERILELHKAGKSNMAIARNLGLGIGEVKLVIDLFEGVG